MDTSLQDREIVERYRRTQAGVGWHTAPDDGYLYNHLAIHLKEAGLVDELNGLFADHHWMHARVAQCGYTYDGYIADLQQAGDVADQAYRQQVQNGQSPTALTDCFRFALIRTSINSLAHDYPPAVIAKSVELDVWTVNRAWSIVKKAPHLEMYVALLSTGRLSEAQRSELVDDAYARVLHLRDHWQEQEAPWWPPSPTAWWFIDELVTTLPYFNDAQRAELLQFDLKWLLGYGWGKAEWQPNIVEQIAPYLSPEQRRQLMEDAAAMFHENYRPQTMALLLPYLDETECESWVDQAYAFALALKWPGSKVEALARVLPFLQPAQRTEALMEALQASTSGDLHPSRRVEGLRLLIPFIPESERLAYIQRVLDLTIALGWGYGSSWELSYLYPLLNEEQKKQVFDIICQTPPNSGSSLIDAVARILPEVSFDQKCRALEAAEAYVEEHNTPNVLIPLLAGMPDELAKPVVERILQATLNIPDAQNYVEAVAAFLPLVGDEQRARLSYWLFEHRSVGPHNSSPSFDTSLLRSVAPYLPQDLIQALYQETLDLQSYSEHVMRFIYLLPRLGETESRAALEKTLNHRHQYASTSLDMELSQLTPVLVGSAREDAARLALDEVLKLVPPMREEQRFQVLPQYADMQYRTSRSVYELRLEDIRRIAPYLNTEQLDLAFHALMERTEIRLSRAEGLTGLLPYLPPEQRTQAVEECYETNKENHFQRIREDLFEPVAPYLTEEMKQEALQTAYEHKDIIVGIGIVRRLSPYLDEPTRQEALDWVFDNLHLVRTNHFTRADVYVRLAPYFDEAKRADALRHSYDDLVSPILSASGDIGRKIEILMQLVKLSTDSTPYTQTIHQLLADYLLTLRDQERHKLLFVCSTILNRLNDQVLNPYIQEQIAMQVVEICETWVWV